MVPPLSVHAAARSVSSPLTVSKAFLSGQISTFVPMPVMAFSLSVSAFSSTTAPARLSSASGVYSSVVPRQITSPFRWYMPFTSCTSRTFLRVARVCKAGYPRPEKFRLLLSSASLHP